MSAPQRLLILGTGSIAHRHGEQFALIPGCELAGAADTNLERAQAYAAEHAIPKAFGSLDDALAWGEFDAAVNATPDPVHAPTTLKLLAAGKHVFCEKPLATNEADALRMTDAADAAGLIAMVNLTYRNAHALQKARAMIDAGEIGAVRHIESSYLQSWLTAAHWGDWRTEERWLWRLSTAHGSTGVLGDIGVHILDFTSFGTGLGFKALQARLKTFDKAENNRIGAYTLDANDSVAITAEMSNGALASIHMTRFASGNLNDLNLAIYGDKGALRIWANHLDSRLSVCLGPDLLTQTWRPLSAEPTPRNEKRFADALVSRVNGEPSFRTAAEVQRLLDLCVVSDRTGQWLAAH